MSGQAFVVAGNDRLTILCAEAVQARGHALAAMITRDARVRAFAEGAGVAVVAPGPTLAAGLAAFRFDWLVSAAFLEVIPDAVLAQARAGAVNFHDGLLPERAGLNAPVWALLEGAAEHGVAWHRIAGAVDGGPVLAERRFAVAPDETAFTLNARCFAAALDSFPEVLDAIAAGRAEGRAQGGGPRRWHGGRDRPAAAGLIDPGAGAAAAARLVRALDHGGYRNPLVAPKIALGGRVWLVAGAEAVAGGAGAPGAVLARGPGTLTLATADGALRLSGLRDADGRPAAEADLPAPGALADRLDEGRAGAAAAALAAVVPAEARVRRRLAGFVPAPVPLARAAEGPAEWRKLALDWPEALAPEARASVAAAWALALSGRAAGGVALVGATRPEGIAAGIVTGWTPAQIAPGTGEDAATLAARLAPLWAEAEAGGFARDLVAREPGLDAAALRPAVALAEAGPPLAGSVITLTTREGALWHDAARLSPAAAALVAARLEAMAAAVAADPARPLRDLPPMPEAEAEAIRARWSGAGTGVPANAPTLPEAIAARAAEAPNAPALIAPGGAVSRGALVRQVAALAAALVAAGVGPGVPVGLCLSRGAGLVAGALAVWRAGGAFVPLDPAWPAARLAHALADTGAPVILTDRAAAPALPENVARRVYLDDPATANAAPPHIPAADAPAYIIHTSGSTGVPKGVVVTHANLAAFAAAMSARIPHAEGDRLLAVTSIAFDIAVLELFWTLSRGMVVVLADEGQRTLPSGGRAPARAASGLDAGDMAFSLFFWGNDDGPGRAKYRLLLEAAEFADAHGFAAVWTPERHFHAFGGPYPNPAVTGAAVAAVTRRIGIRAGSCVAPLHHPARIAEDWAVIDNLSDGRAGLGIASGWMPEDFVLRPEAAPPANRDAMLAAIDALRRLWRGEAVEFPAPGGGMQAVRTLPRPVSRELALWLTTAGNPATWTEAGRLGTHVLTHLLGQSLDEVAGKVALYRAARAGAGHDPAAGEVALMLHTYLDATDRERARATARAPMIAYLRSAAGLIRNYAWAFPAFKRPPGAAAPADLDLGTLTGEELDGILDFAFERYFERSGLFGTVDDALARVAEARAAGMAEIACLIDYGIAPAKVLEGLRPLAEVVARSNAPAPVAGAADGSIAGLIARHGVTHLQATPTLWRLLVEDAGARAALAGLRCILSGGEGLASGLAAALAAAAPGAAILNLYGPTEATVWATSGPAGAGAPVADIGTPLPGRSAWVLDGAMGLLPAGVTGELWLGGAGVAAGYWRRDELTAARFVPDPFAPGGRLYRTGDLAMWREDGTLAWQGRADDQVKLRGHRVEPGEIEAAIEALPGVARAAVGLRTGPSGEPALVAWLTGTAPPDAAGLRAALAGRLPSHMLPERAVALAALPQTPNGKTDRAALPDPWQGAPEPAAARRAAPAPAASGAPARGDLAAVVTGVWEQVLGRPGLGPEAHFFDAGGHSLLAVQAHRALRAALGDDPAAGRLALTDFFRFPVLGALVAHLGGGGGPTPPPPLPAAPDDAAARRRALRAAREGARAGGA